MSNQQSELVIEDAYPMSMLQQGMLFHSIKGSHLNLYHDVLTFKLKMEWNQEVFSQTLNYLGQKHAILRTVFHLDQARPLQLVIKSKEFKFETVDIREFDNEGKNTSLEKWVEEEKRKGVDLSTYPWRICIFILSEHEVSLGLSFHHALWDGWSNANFVNELLSSYKSLLIDGELVDSSNPPAYKNFIALEQKALSSKSNQKYWREKFLEVELPWWTGEQQAESIPFLCEVSKKTSHDIIKLARSVGVQEKSLWNAVYLTLLAMLGGNSEVVGSVVIHGRPEIEGSDKTLGLFLNTLPIKLNISGMRWIDLIKSSERELVTLHDMRHFPLISVQNQTELDFSASMFNYTNFHIYGNSNTEKQIDAKGGFEDTNYRLTFQVSKDEKSSRHSIYMTADPSVFDESFRTRIQGYVSNIVERLISESNQTINLTDLKGARENSDLLKKHNENYADYPSDKCINELFESQAKSTPNSIALIEQCERHGVRHLSYNELNSRANQLANYLVKEGVSPEKRVGLSVERSQTLIIGILAILKSGGVYVPISTDIPSSRMKYMLTDSNVDILLTEESKSVNLRELESKVFLMDNKQNSILLSKFSKKNLQNRKIGIKPDNLGYIIYTSGSTGEPKGVMGLHRSLVNRINWLQKKVALEAMDVFCQRTSIGFVDHIAEIFQPLSNGSPLVILEQHVIQAPVLLNKMLNNWCISYFTLVPSLLINLLDSKEVSAPKLRIMHSSGEALNSSDLSEFKTRFPNSRLLNIYGSTEVGADVSCCEIKEFIGLGSAVSNIGQVIDNTDAYILGNEGEILPLGVPGELLIGGANLSRGYLARASATAERFIPHPFTQEPGTRLFRTGDLARYLTTADGCAGDMEYIGRADNQIKIRGFRIEPSEIAIVLRKHCLVKDVVVTTTNKDINDIRLVAYLILEDQNVNHLDESKLKKELRSSCSADLPAYMMPSTFIVLTEFPLTASGKIARNKLPAPDMSYQSSEYSVPEGVTEELLAGLWSEILGNDKVGRFDNFFELGGHSLLITQLMSRIRATFSVELNIKDLFESQTLKQQAELIQSGNLLEELQMVKLTQEIRDKGLPLSFAQKRLWFLSQYMGPSAVYNMSLALRLRGNLVLDALTDSLEEIYARHESLRTRFEANKDSAIQIIDPAELKLSVERVSNREKLLEICRSEKNYLFDLAKDRLCRIRILHNEAGLDSSNKDSHILLVTIHHSVTDGWSQGIFFKELVALYQAKVNKRPSPLTPLKYQYADFTNWQRESLQGDRLKRQLEYWRDQLSGLPPLLDLPTDRRRPSEQTFRGSVETVSLTKGLSNKLQLFSKQQGVTLYMTLLSAFSVLLGRYSNQNDIAIGTLVANRTRKETEEMIGFFVNTLVMRSDLSRDPNFVELLQATKETALRGYENQDIPFELLVEKLSPDRSLSHSPLFQVLFALQNVPLANATLEGLEVEPLTLDLHQNTNSNHTKSELELAEEGVSRFDLSLVLQQTKNGIAGEIEYNTDLFESSTIRQMFAHFERLLEAILDSPNLNVSRLEFISIKEREQQLSYWNKLDSIYPKNGTVHQLFESQVVLTPDATALIYDEQQITYVELNQRANQLAHYLIENGVCPEVRVGLCMERCIDMVVGLFGILKAGACYVPIDPNYPQGRLDYILDDSTVEIIITNQKTKQMLQFSQDTRNDEIVKFVCPEQWQTKTNNKDNPKVDVSPLSLAYMIYTSGSTGKPKGVMVNHTNVCDFLYHSIESFLPVQIKGAVVSSPLVFDATVGSLLVPLCSGKYALLLPDDASTLDCLSDCLLRSQESLLFKITPAHLEAVLSNGTSQKNQELEHVIVVAGERLNHDVITPWIEEMLPRSQFINEYGPTETTVGATINPLRLSDFRDLASVPIGQSLGETSLYVLNNQLCLQSVGSVGELYIGGTGVTRGYLGKAQMSSLRFIPDPYSCIPGSRLYRTGDLVKRMSNGDLEFIGRVDNQVKIRGYRIELGEIESHIMQHPEIRSCVVEVENDSSSYSKLLAYYVKEPRVELWPSISEFFVYDYLAYRSMSTHVERVNMFRTALIDQVKDKVVVEIGPGSEAVLTQLCVKAGARHVYAVEINYEIYLEAKRSVEKNNLVDRITVIHGDIMQVNLPEIADFCLSAIVGHIGGSEGSAILIEGARRLLRNPQNMIPARSNTKMAAINLSQEEFDYGFNPIAKGYVDSIWKQKECEFEFRLCLKNITRKSLVSTEVSFEDLDYTQALSANNQHQVSLTCLCKSRVTGFLLWVEIDFAQKLKLNTLDDQGSWLPVYFPISCEGYEVDKGDSFELTIRREVCANTINPDYFIEGSLIRAGQKNVIINYESYQQERMKPGNTFYEKLFAENGESGFQSLSENDLREYLAEQMPDYMIPNLFMKLDSLPLTVNGKVDRKALPSPTSLMQHHEFSAPEGITEDLLASLWKRILKCKQVSRTDNFFNLGGHSLLATQLASRIRETFSVEVEIRELFENQTIQEQAEVITSQQASSDFIASPMGKVNREKPLLLSYAQQRLWFLSQYMGPNSVYNMSIALSLEGVIDTRALIRSLQEIYKRHESLRTRFEPWGDTAVQIIDPPSLEIDVETVTTDEALRAISDSERLFKFDLSKDRLVRFRLLSTKSTSQNTSYALLVTMHHSISDGWSIGIFLQELIALYQAFRKNEKSPLISLPIQYVDYADWQRNHLKGKLLESQLTYWSRQLADLPPFLNLPLDRERPKEQTYRGRNESVSISSKLSSKLQTLSDENGVTLYMTLLSAFSVLMGRYACQNDVAVGTPIANRTRKETEGLIGFFVNTLVMRSDLSQDPTFTEFLKQTREMALQGYAHQDIPFEQLVDELSSNRNLSYSPLFQVMFALQNIPQENIILDELKISPLELKEGQHSEGHIGVSRFDLSMILQESAQGIMGTVEYNCDLFDQVSIKNMLANFERLLKEIVESPQTRISSLEFISEDEKKYLIGRNYEKADLEEVKSIEKVFETELSEQPNNIALEEQGKQINYFELNIKASKLANHLMSQGMKVQGSVAIYMDNIVDIGITALAVFKAGGCCVPLDINYPSHRIKNLIEEANVKVVVANRSAMKNRGYNNSICNDYLDSSQIESVRYIELESVLDEEANLDKLNVDLANSKEGVLKKSKLHSNSSYLACVVQNLTHGNQSIFQSLTHNTLAATLYLDKAKAMKTHLSIIQNLATFLKKGVLSYDFQSERTFLLDNNGHMVTSGIPAELYLSGNTMPRDYYNQASLTAAHFLPNPYSDKVGERIYRTGLFARLLNSKKVELIEKSNLISRRNSIHSARLEIENLLLKDDRIEEVTMTYENESPSLGCMTGYLVLSQKNVGLAEQRHLRKELQQLIRLSSTLMRIPDKLIILNSIPRTSTGLVDRKELKNCIINSNQQESYVSPETKTEKLLVNIWQRMLGLKRIGIEDNYFVLGGDSIRSISLVAEARKSGLEFSIKDLFEFPTIYSLSNALDKGALVQEDSYEEIPPFSLLVDSEHKTLNDKYKLSEIEDAYPLSLMQQGMVLHAIKQSHLNVYQNMHVYYFNDKWDEPSFNRSLTYLVSKHPMLRSVYDLTTERPLQIVLKDCVPNIKVIDVSHCDQVAIQNALNQWMQTEHALGLDTSKELWRLTVHLLPDNGFLFCMFIHHAQWDGWSLESFATELYSTYEKVLNQCQVVEQKKLPSFNHFISLEQKAIESREQKNYWVNKLTGANLPWWTGVEKTSSTNIVCEVSAESSLRIIELARLLGVQEKSVWCSVYHILMALLDGSDELTVPVINQGRPEIPDGDKMVGVFLNVLPLRLSLTGKSWSEFIKNADQELREQHAYRRYPLTEIQRVTNLDFSAVLFTYTNWHVYHQKEANSEQLVMSNKSDNIRGSFTPQKFGGNQETNYLMDVYVGKDELTQKFSMNIAVDSKLFGPEFRERIKGYVTNIISELEANSNQLIDKQHLIGTKELNRTLFEWNSTTQTTTDDNRVHELFELQVKQTPNAIALKHSGEELSYSELNMRANQLAHCLKTHDVGPDVRVGICVERSIEMVVGILGVLKSGGCYVPLDPEYPEERLQNMMEQSGCQLVLSEQHLLTELVILQMVKTLPLDKELHQLILGSYSRENLPNGGIGNTQDSLAYLIFTSGSTGLPKGVQVTHKGLTNYLIYTKRQYFTTCSGAVVSTSLNFDATVTSLLGPLICGKFVELVNQDGNELQSLQNLLFESEEELLFKLTPSHLDAVVQTHKPGVISERKHKLVVGGEQLNQRLVDYWQDKLLPNGSIINEYGPTETVVGCSTYTVEAKCLNEPSSQTVPIGQGIDNTQLYVVDNNLIPVPIGVLGELLVGGLGVARGYLNHSASTAEKFVPDPFSKTSSARLYRTGDLARFLPDGSLEFIGRADSQVKIRGFRIELGEIEAAIRKHKLVKDVVVVAKQDLDENQQLVAYVVSKIDDTDHNLEISKEEIDSQILLANELRTSLQAQLPGYMIPSAFVFLESLPLTINGKVDLRELPALDYSQLQASYVAPNNDIEKQLCEYWQELLKVEQIGIRDNFWELGGQSLLALRLSNMLRQKFALEVSLEKLFEYQVIEELAKFMALEIDAMHLRETGVITQTCENDIEEGVL